MAIRRTRKRENLAELCPVCRLPYTADKTLPDGSIQFVHGPVTISGSVQYSVCVIDVEDRIRPTFDDPKRL